MTLSPNQIAAMDACPSGEYEVTFLRDSTIVGCNTAFSMQFGVLPRDLISKRLVDLSEAHLSMTQFEQVFERVANELVTVTLGRDVQVTASGSAYLTTKRTVTMERAVINSDGFVVAVYRHSATHGTDEDAAACMARADRVASRARRALRRKQLVTSESPGAYGLTPVERWKNLKAELLSTDSRSNGGSRRVFPRRKAAFTRTSLLLFVVLVAGCAIGWLAASKWYELDRRKAAIGDQLLDQLKTEQFPNGSDTLSTSSPPSQ